MSLKKNWALTQDAFDLLLRRLDAEPREAARRYEELRRALITFFECRGSRFPEDHADETIDRVARRLLEGREIYTENPAAYFHGVARNVLKEYWDAPRPMSPLENVPESIARSDDPVRIEQQQHEQSVNERKLDCLEQCLTALNADERTFIDAYYQGLTSVKIQNRKRLAAELGIGMNALRIRALRIREKLEQCVGACVRRSSDA